VGVAAVCALAVDVGVRGIGGVVVLVGIPVATVGLTIGFVCVAVATPPAVAVLVGVAGEPVVVCGGVEVAVLVGISVPIVGLAIVSVSVAVAPAGTVGVSVAGGLVIVSVEVEVAVGSGTTICPSVQVVTSGAAAESVEFATIKSAPEHDNGKACPAIALGEITTEQV
jgi:hypothetical protein